MFKRLIRQLPVMFAILIGITFTESSDAAYPDKMIMLVVPYPPGGPTDLMARRLADGLGKQLGQNVVVENRSGANGNIGALSVAKAKPDGYTLLFGTSGPLAINGSLYRSQGYDPETSFSPIIRIGYLPNVLITHPSIPAKNLTELLEYAKQHPNDLVYASSGNGASSHLAGVLFNSMAGTHFEHIPYKGTGPALNELLGGHVSMAFTDILTALPYINTGKLNAIGLASAQRSDAIPDLPTLQEQGLPGYDVSVFFGIVGPNAMSPEIITTLNQAFVRTLNSPEIMDVLKSQGIVRAEDTSPEGLKTFISNEVNKWQTVIKNGHVQID